MTSRHLQWTGPCLIALLVGCTEAEKVDIGTREEGFSCKQVSDCVAGLDCVEGACLPLDSIFTGPERGDPCTNDDACVPDLVCGRQGVCTISKGAPLDSTCGLTVECEWPLVCHGQSGVCAPDDDGAGTYDIDESCTQLTDCRRPYVCNLANQPAAKCDRMPEIQP